ncbi:tape measure protein [Vibrio phage vB_VpaM_R16F]|nr:tape measure protein [Vibrio phage vB_VpaM_R16F]
MSAAAAKAGLIDGTMSQQKQEAALRKLMENGNAIASEILPHFGKELQKLARENNGLAIAMEQNFNPALQRAKDTIIDLEVAAFDGLKPSLMAVLRSFTRVGEEGNTLAKTLGTLVGGAITGLTFPIALVVSGLTDLVTLFKEVTGVSDETTESFLGFVAQAAGVTLGLFGLFRALKLMRTGLGWISTGFGKVSAASNTAAKGIGVVTGAAKTALSVFSKLFGVISSLMIFWDARAGGDLSATSLFGQNSITEWLDKPITEHFSSSAKQIQSKQSIDVNIGVDPATGNLNGYVTGKMDEYVNDMFQGTYNSMSPSN